MATSKIQKKEIIYRDYSNLNINVPANGYNQHQLDISSMLSNGYVPLNAYINGDSLALAADVQNFLNSWYLVFRNYSGADRVVNSARVFFSGGFKLLKSLAERWCLA